MSDIVDRLRHWIIAVDAMPASDLMDEAAGEIERLRSGAAARRESVQLTDAERTALRDAARSYEYDADDSECGRIAATYRSLLERSNHDAVPAAIASVESVAPQPTTRGESDRTDKAAPRPSESTGNTSDRLQPVKGDDFDRPKPISDSWLAGLEPLAVGRELIDRLRRLNGAKEIRTERTE